MFNRTYNAGETRNTPSGSIEIKDVAMKRQNLKIPRLGARLEERATNLLLEISNSENVDQYSGRHRVASKS